MRIAIIGAGMAGLACGTRLVNRGHNVTLFDKGRGPGGRMATRRAEVHGTTLHFDHGAQYFTVTDPRFAEQVSAWEVTGVVARWPAAGEGAWVGTPGMNAPVRALAQALEVRFGVRVEALERDERGWRLAGEDLPRARFDAVLVAVPAEQVAALVAPHAAAFAAQAEATVSEPCWTLMLAFDGAVDHADTLRNAGAIGWAARNSAKPGRGRGECWVVQASPSWSREYLEAERDTVIALLVEHFRQQVGGALPAIVHADAHRWRYALCAIAEGEGALWDAEQRIGLCGDWLVGPRVEGAWLSGMTLADMVEANG
ncbi:MAG: FAD-dependent oxidoreductase [Erythrobacter sp.]|nr:MAG: FAD-dependent oxidoreductase [Erythrobacter sp.]